jgi:hypothetical protein
MKYNLILLEFLRELSCKTPDHQGMHLQSELFQIQPAAEVSNCGP